MHESQRILHRIHNGLIAYCGKGRLLTAKRNGSFRAHREPLLSFAQGELLPLKSNRNLLRLERDCRFERQGLRRYFVCWRTTANFTRSSHR
jgi:hypothetical protein